MVYFVDVDGSTYCAELILLASSILNTVGLGFVRVGESGMGAYHGKVGFDAFSHYKSIVDKKTWMDLPMR